MAEKERCDARSRIQTPYDRHHFGPDAFGTLVSCDLPEGHDGNHISWPQYIAWSDQPSGPETRMCQKCHRVALYGIEIGDGPWCESCDRKLDVAIRGLKGGERWVL